MSTPQPTTSGPPLPLPEALNPDALDVLSELAHLLTRLRTLPTTTTASSIATTTTTTTTTTGATPAAAAASHATPTPTPTALLSSHAARKPGGELTLKEIPVATDALKHRFQRARTLVKTALPDLDRGIADQEAEIAALEARIARQRDTLARLREVGARLAVQAEGDKMEE